MEMVQCQEAPLHGRPFQKGSLYKLLPIFEVCIFMSKKKYGKIRPDARQVFTDPCRTFFFISKILSVTIIWKLQCLYHDQCGVVEGNSSSSRLFSIHAGVRQGCVLVVFRFHIPLGLVPYGGTQNTAFEH